MSKNIDYKSEYWLYDQYWNKGKFLKTIGEMCGVDDNTIHYWMKKFNIARRNRGNQGVSPFAGRSHSKEVKEAMSVRSKEWHEKHPRMDDKNPNWKGGGWNFYHVQARRTWEEHWDINIQGNYVVHHVDRDITNNDICNLVLLTQSEHRKEHWKDRRKKC